MSDRLIDPDAASRLLGVSTRTLLRYAQAGRLWSTFTVGGHRRYRHSDVVALKLELERGSTR